MIKKETVSRFEDSNFITIIKPFFEKQGFKFKKREGTKKLGEFELTFSCYCNDHYPGVYYNPTIQTPEIQYISYLRVWHPVFNLWCKDNFPGHHLHANNSIANLCFTLPISINQLSAVDFFTPINGDPKSSLQSLDFGFSSFFDLMNAEYEPQNWHNLLEQTAALADLESMYCHDAGKPGKYISLIYRNEMERANAAVQELLQLSIKAYHDEPKLDYKQSRFSGMKRLQSNAKQFLNIEFELPVLLEWKSEIGKETGTIPIVNINWKELYTLKELPISIYRSFLNDVDGTFLTTHTLYRYTGEIVFWDINGQIKHHTDYNSISASDCIGFIPEKNVYFMSNLLIFENGNTAYLPIGKVVDGNGDFGYEWVCTDVVFDDALSNYIVCSGKEDNISTVWFFNESFEVVKTLELPGIPKKIYTEKQWFVVLDRSENTCKVLDYEGNIIHVFETRNAMFEHQFFGGYRWLIVYGYHSSSEVYELATQKTFKIYGHPTFISGYKDNFQQVEHNFGLAKFAFSPDGRYAVGSADHGKWVVWTMPDWKRQEIHPNEDYLAESLEPYFFEIDGESYFVNNGQVKTANGVGRSAFMNRASAIYFMENGLYFLMIIKDKLLIFNNQFQHLETYKGFENMVLKGNYFFNYVDKNLRVSIIE